MQARHHPSPLRFPATFADRSSFTVAPINPPLCECADCGNSYYTVKEQSVDRHYYLKKLSNEEAQDIIGALMQTAKDTRQALLKQCETHGDRILNRWKEASRSKRESWLLQAGLELPNEQWFYPCYTYQYPHWKETRKHRKKLLLPYLSVDLLKTEPSILLGLLDNRTRYLHEEWASFDSHQLKAS